MLLKLLISIKLIIFSLRAILGTRTIVVNIFQEILTLIRVSHIVGSNRVIVRKKVVISKSFVT